MLESVILNELEQGTPEWLAARSGIPTASEAECLLVKGKAEHGLGTGAITYARKVAGEIILGGPLPSYQSPAMEHGSEYEPVLRDEYCFLRNVSVKEVGMVQVVDSGQVIAGFSPDGLVGDDGIIEIKRREPKILIGLITGGDLPKSEYVQGQFGLWATERKWVDHVSGFPGMPTSIRRVERDEKTIEQIKDAVRRFNTHVAELVEAVRAYGLAA